MSTATDLTPTLDLDHVALVVTAEGRELILVPDHIAVALKAHRQDGFVDDLVAGHSRTFGPGTWVHTITEQLMDWYAATPVPAGLAPDDAWHAGRDRYTASRHHALWPMLAGAGDYNPTTRQWRDYNANQHLHPGGTLHVVPRHGYRWEN